MAERTFGWIQNPSSFENLKNVVSLFIQGSQIYQKVYNKINKLVLNIELKNKLIAELNNSPLIMSYSLLKGSGIKMGQLRSDAECSGIVQAAISTQKGREYTDDWTADGFLRWAISLGFLDYNSFEDSVKITEFGYKYALTKTKDEEKEILIKAFLSYPPAFRILNLLSNGKTLTKFELGSQLGGLGEPGFTSIPQDIYIQALTLSDPNSKVKIRSNTEGSSDKYARMICSWLIKVNLVQKESKIVSTVIGNKEYSIAIGHSFKITLEGFKRYNSSKGISSSKKIEKIVYWQMLATKGIDRDYVRNRRAHIIFSILNKHKTIEEIQLYLNKQDINESLVTIKDELSVIKAMGLNVNLHTDKYILADNISKLNIPRKTISKTGLLALKDSIREKLHFLNHRYLSLIDLAYDRNSSRDFEIQTIDLFKNELSFKGLRLGESRKPDGIISFKSSGIIIDNKAYADGYNLPINQADEMIRYIEENKERSKNLNSNEWWTNFEDGVSNFYYLFVTSFLKGGFQSNLDYIFKRTWTKGAAIDVENLLYLAEELKSGRLHYMDTFNLFMNKEIKIIIQDDKELVKVAENLEYENKEDK